MDHNALVASLDTDPQLYVHPVRKVLLFVKHIPSLLVPVDHNLNWEHGMRKKLRKICGMMMIRV